MNNAVLSLKKELISKGFESHICKDDNSEIFRIKHFGDWVNVTVVPISNNEANVYITTRGIPLDRVISNSAYKVTKDLLVPTTLNLYNSFISNI